MAQLAGRPTRRRFVIVGPLLMLVGVGIALFCLFSEPSVSVPFVGATTCGRPAIGLAFHSESNISGDQLDRALTVECIDDARSDVFRGALAELLFTLAGAGVSIFEALR